MCFAEAISHRQRLVDHGTIRWEGIFLIRAVAVGEKDVGSIVENWYLKPVCHGSWSKRCERHIGGLKRQPDLDAAPRIRHVGDDGFVCRARPDQTRAGTFETVYEKTSPSSQG